jgi:hypothetical protein
MMQVQFFLFGLLLVWFIGTGKLAALFSALASAPAAGSIGTSGATSPGGALSPVTAPGPSDTPGSGGVGGTILVNGCQPTLDGKTNAISGSILDPSQPICHLGPFG